MKKKSFLSLPKEGDDTEPAARMLSSIPQRKADMAAQQAPSPSAAAPASGTLLSLAQPKPETKSKRVQLLLKPSLFDRSKSAADGANISFNEIVSIALERLLQSFGK